MIGKKSLGKSEQYELFVDSFGLWLEIIEGAIELEFNGEEYVRLDLQTLQKSDLISLATALVDYADRL